MKAPRPVIVRNKGGRGSQPDTEAWGRKIIKGEPLVGMVTVDLGFHLAGITLTRIGDLLLSRKYLLASV